MKTKLNELLDEHEGALIFTCFLGSALVGYFFTHFASFIH